MKSVKTAVMMAVIMMVGIQAYAEDMTIKGDGVFTGEAGLIIDGVIVEEGKDWNDEHCVNWTETSVAFVIDMMKEFSVRNMMIQVDHNDTYAIEYSMDGKEFKPLFTIIGNKGKVDYGMQSVYTDGSRQDHYPGTAFEPVAARFVKIRAVEGDDAYGIAEISIEKDAVSEKKITESDMVNEPSETEPVVQEESETGSEVIPETAE